MLRLQALARSRIIGNMVSALTVQKAFLNNLENIVNRRVDILSVTKTLSVTHRVRSIIAWEKIFTCCLVIWTWKLSQRLGYNNKILVSDGTFSLWNNDKVNTLELVRGVGKPKSHETVVRPTITYKDSQKQTITHEEERVAFVLALASTFGIWYAFRQWEVPDKATSSRWSR